MEQRFLVSHVEVERILRKVGYPQELIDEVLSELPDPNGTARRSSGTESLPAVSLIGWVAALEARRGEGRRSSLLTPRPMRSFPRGHLIALTVRSSPRQPLDAQARDAVSIGT